MTRLVNWFYLVSIVANLWLFAASSVMRANYRVKADALIFEAHTYTASIELVKDQMLMMRKQEQGMMDTERQLTADFRGRLESDDGRVYKIREK